MRKVIHVEDNPEDPAVLLTPHVVRREELDRDNLIAVLRPLG